jgi:hypothetical protein
MRSGLLLFAAACTAAPSSPATGGHVPSLGTTSLFLASGTISFTGATAPGTAHFDAAPVDSDTRAAGTGGFDVNVSGTDYASSAAQAMAFTSADDTGTSYLILADFVEDPATNVGQVVYVVVPSADYAPGATVALDGQDRIALFAAGDVNTDAPSVAAAAVSGTITFGTDGDLTTAISATLSADFGPVDWQTIAPGDADAGPTTRPTGGVADGPTQLVVDPAQAAQVRCDGSLSGKEADFAGLAPADLGFASGPITVTNVDPDTITIAGDVLGPALGATSAGVTLTDTPDAPGVFWIDAPRTGSGPDGAALTDAALAVDAGDASAGSDVMAGFATLYQTADGGSCQVWFDATLPGAGSGPTSSP